MKKSMLALLMTLALICSCALAAAEEARWGASADSLTEKGTLWDAIEAANSGAAAYIRLESEPAGMQYTINGGEFTIDLNGVTYTYDGYPFCINNGDVTFEDSKGGGSVYATEPGYSAIVLSDGELTINGGRYLGGYTAVRVDSGSVKITDGRFEGDFAIDNNGTVRIEDGSFGGSYAIYNSGKMEIADGKFEGTSDYAVENHDDGKVRIEKGSFTGAYSAINNYGEMEIADGKFEGLNNYAVYNEANGKVRIEKGSFTGAYSAIKNHGEIEIADGKFESAGYCVVDNGSNGTVYIAGGSFTGANAAICNDGETEITGGDFECIDEEWTPNVFECCYSTSKLTISGNTTFTMPEHAEKVLVGWVDGGMLDLSGCENLDGWQIRQNSYDITGKYKLPEDYVLRADSETPEQIAGEHMLYILYSIPVKVSFDWNGGNGQTKSMNAMSGDKMTLPRDWTQAPSGLYFMGWSEQKTDGERITGSYMPKRDVTLYAQWGVLTCVYHENVGDGSRTKTVTLQPGLAYIAEECPFEARPGYYFNYWSSEPEGDVRVDRYLPESGMEEMTLYAIWDKIETEELYVGGKPLAKGEFIDNSGNVSRVKPAGGYAYFDENGLLTLCNYSYIGKGAQFDDGSYACINARGTLRIELVGENTLIAAEEGIRAENGTPNEDGEYVQGDLIIGGSGTLTVRSTRDAIYANGDDLIIYGGTYVIDEKNNDALDAADDITIYGGTFTINAGDNGIEADEYLKVFAGTFDITAGNNGVDVDDEDFDFYNGTMNITAGQHGVYVEEEDFDFYNGTMNITAKENGIYLDDEDMSLYGGKISIEAGKKGVNAYESIYVYNGELTVYSVEEALYAGDGFNVDNGAVTAFTENGLGAVMAGEDLWIHDILTVYEPEAWEIEEIDAYGDDWEIIVDAQGEAADYVVIGKKAKTFAVPVSSENAAKIDALMMGSKVILMDGEEEIDQAVGTGKKDTLTFDLSGVSVKNPMMVLSQKTTQKLGEEILGKGSTVANLCVKMPEGLQATFDRNVMKTLTTAEDGVSLRFTMYPKVEEELTTAQKDTIGERPAYHAQWLRNGEVVHNLGGTATLSAGYRLNSGERADRLAVHFVDEMGAKETCQSAYDEKGKRIEWTTDHLSVYMIDHVPEDNLPATGDSSMLGAWVALLGAAGMGLKLRRKKAS